MPTPSKGNSIFRSSSAVLAIFLNFYSNFSSIDVERAKNLKE
jgi:hypothetical protein